MSSLLDLNFPPLKVAYVKDKNDFKIWCPIRRKKYKLTPEEWVRQHLISFLIQIKNYPPALISVEKTLIYNQLKKRWDIATFDLEGNPFLLIECKSFTQTLNRSVFEQIYAYQKIVKAPFLAVSNGLDHRIFHKESKTQNLIELDRFPDFNFE